MKHANISIFVPHIGCPHRCSFCDQRTISGTQHAPSADDVRAVCEKALGEAKSPENTEIAFFGGSFTAIPRGYMTELLETAHEFTGEGKFKGIRISTRPDRIDREVLDILKKYGVTAIELGAQSMCDDVLEANERGHTAEDVFNASKLIREYGFELGLQMMTGLYKSNLMKDMFTAHLIVGLHPDTVRIYPVVVLKGTRLGELYEKGVYEMPSFDEMTALCAKLIVLFEEKGVRVIKCGLHASEFVEKDMIGGYYHPAFRELCENAIYKDLIWDSLFEMADMKYPQNYGEEELSKKVEKIHGEHIVAVDPSCISKAVGQRRSNIRHFSEQGIDIKIIGDENVAEYKVELRR